MAKTKGLDMLNGALLPKLMMFSLPLALTGILQLLFNAADVIVVGKFAGSTSLAAVGATSALINLLTGAFIGISVGVNILVARYVGCRDDAGVSRAVHCAITLSLILGVITFLIGFFLSTPLLELMATPDSTMPSAETCLSRDSPRITAATAMEPMNDHREMATPPVRFRVTMAKAAPKVAPWETPRVEADASGLWRMAWRMQPARPNPAPATMAVQMRGRRLLRMTRFTFLSADFPKMPLISSAVGVL